MSVRIGFFGTPEVAVEALEALVASPDVEVAVVVTNPDRPRGRTGQALPPPVKVAAEAAGVPVLQPAKPAEIVDQLIALRLDACAVVAYGAILPTSVLETATHGFVNLHFSLLPRWRGAAPVQHAIRAGDEATGITTFVLDKGMDTGPILDQVEVAIGDRETSGELLARLATLGAPLLRDSVVRLVDGQEPVEQPAEGATLAPKVTPEDAAIDWTAAAAEVDRLVRSVHPAPGAHTTFRGARLKVHDAIPTDGTGEPGVILSAGRDGVVVACGAGAVRLAAIQPEGKARIDGAAFVNGYRPEPGERLGTAP